MRVVLVDASSLLFPTIYNSQGFELTTSRGQLVTCVYSFLDDILSLSEELESNKFVILFDSKGSVRKNACPTYKCNRQEVSDEIKEKRHQLYQQIPILKEFLTSMGICHLEICGFEADDLIASIVQNNRLTRFYTVSTDHDLWQTLGKNNMMYNFSRKTFKDDYSVSEKFPGLEAHDYWKILSLSGCSTDNVAPIVKGVGEKTAYKYLTGTLKPESKIFKSIEENIHKAPENEALVRLPHSACIALTDINERIGELDQEGFIAKCMEYEFDSFLENENWDKFFRLR